MCIMMFINLDSQLLALTVAHIDYILLLGNGTILKHRDLSTAVTESPIKLKQEARVKLADLCSREDPLSSSPSLSE